MNRWRGALSRGVESITQLGSALATRVWWRQGLVHLVCSICGRDLDWAPPTFAARHPAPLCPRCRPLVDEGSLQRPAVVLPPGGGSR